MAGRLCCTTSGEGEVGGSSRIHVRKTESRSAVKREKEKKVLVAEGSDTKLRITKMFNLLVSQPFLYIYIYIYIYKIEMITTQEYNYNIFYIVIFYNYNNNNNK